MPTSGSGAEGSRQEACGTHDQFNGGSGRGGNEQHGDAAADGGGGFVCSSGSGRGSGSSGGGGGRIGRPAVRCFRCNRRGHRKANCTTQEHDFLPTCGRCGGAGHTEIVCTSDPAVMESEVLTPEMAETVDAEAFLSEERTTLGECRESSVILAGRVERARRSEEFILTTSATSTVFSSNECFSNYRECDRQLRTANEDVIQVVGLGDVLLSLRSAGERVSLHLRDVLHAPRIGFNLISHFELVQAGHSIAITRKGAEILLKGGDSLHFPYKGKLACQYGSRVHPSETACVAVAPGFAKAATTPTKMDVNYFHCTYGHVHELLLKQTARQLGVELTGSLHECFGCSMARSLRKPIAMSRHTRAARKLERVFVGLSGVAVTQSLGGCNYAMIVRDDFSRWTRLFFLKHKSETASAFETFLAEVRADGIPSEVIAVRSDDGGEFCGGEFGGLCESRGIKQVFLPAISALYNRVAERALGIITDAALAARLQAPRLFSSAPTHTSLWAEAMSWACAVLNRTATTANTGGRSPYQLWYGTQPPKEDVWPFLRPTTCRVRQTAESPLQAQLCHYLGPATNRPSEYIRVLLRNNKVMVTRGCT